MKIYVLIVAIILVTLLFGCTKEINIMCEPEGSNEFNLDKSDTEIMIQDCYASEVKEDGITIDYDPVRINVPVEPVIYSFDEKGYHWICPECGFINRDIPLVSREVSLRGDYYWSVKHRCTNCDYNGYRCSDGQWLDANYSIMWGLVVE